MDNYKIKIVSNNSHIDITKIVGNLSWSNSINSLGTKLSFDTARNSEDKYLNALDLVKVGSIILLTNNNKEVFRGIVVTEDIEQYKKSFSCLDFAFYLNQSKVIKQFNSISVSTAIKQLCNSFNVPIGYISSIPTTITKIYNEKTIAEIIKDMLNKATQETGIKYRLEMREGKLYIEKHIDLTVKATYLGAIGSIKRNKSILNMKNSIVVYSGNETYSSVEANVKDTANIAKYGLLQDTIKVDEKDISQARNIARKRLEELSKVITSTSIELLGNDQLKAGRILELNVPSYEIKGQFLIKNCTHTYSNSIHKCRISLGEL